MSSQKPDLFTELKKYETGERLQNEAKFKSITKEIIDLIHDHISQGRMKSTGGFIFVDSDRHSSDHERFRFILALNEAAQDRMLRDIANGLNFDCSRYSLKFDYRAPLMLSKKLLGVEFVLKE